MDVRLSAIVLVAGLYLTGCATITGSESQSLSLTATDADGKAIEKAECSLDNDKGRWVGVTPSFVNVRRSAEDLTVVCKKTGFVDGVLNPSL